MSRRIKSLGLPWKNRKATDPPPSGSKGSLGAASTSEPAAESNKTEAVDLRDTEAKNSNDLRDTIFAELKEVEQASEPEASGGVESGDGAAEDPEDLWGIALSKLRKENPKLVHRYEEILRWEWLTTWPGPDAKPAPDVVSTSPKDKLAALAVQKFSTVEYTKRSSPGLDRVVKIVISAKDFIASVAAKEPNASLPWAGVSVLLPLLLNSTMRYTSVVDGIERIPSLLNRCKVYEDIHLSRTGSTVAKASIRIRGLGKSLKDYLLVLYTDILQFQAQAVCQLSRFAIYKYFPLIFRANDWTALLDNITLHYESCKIIFDALNNDCVTRALAEQEEQTSWLLEASQNVKGERYDEAKSECHKALFFNYTAQKNRNPRRAPGTCEWLLRHEKFSDWYRSLGSRLLFVTTEPGCGKSVLARALVDEHLVGRDPITAKVCYFFFKDNSPDNRSAKKALSSILHQLFAHDPSLIEHAMPTFKQRGSKMTESLELMWEVFERVVADPSAGEIVIVFDALDECDIEERHSFIAKLNSFFPNLENEIVPPKSDVKILITSRWLWRSFSRLVARYTAVELYSERRSDDIKREMELLMDDRIPDICTKLKLHKTAASELRHALLKTENRTYLWFHLMIESFESSSAVSRSSDIQEFIRTIPPTVDEAYERNLKCLSYANRRKAEKLLHIILAAVRPLSVHELNIAYSISVDDDPPHHPKLQDDAAFIMTARKLGGSMICIVDSKVEFLHQTVAEFLTWHKHYEYATYPLWEHSLRPQTCHRTIAEACIRYLQLCDFIHKGRCSLDREVLEHMTSYPLLEYAARYWGTHCAKSNIDEKLIVELVSDELKAQALLQLCLTPFDETAARLEPIDGLGDLPQLCCSYGLGTNEAHLLAHFGLDSLLDVVLDPKRVIGIDSPTDCADSYGETPLFYAARAGHFGMLDALLVRGALLSAQNRRGENVLHVALRNGHQDTAKMLLQNGFAIDETTFQGKTALMLASSQGLLDVVGGLVDRGAALEATETTGSGWTALFFAVYNGHFDVVSRLLDAGAVVDAKDTYEKTPLALAALLGFGSICSRLVTAKALVDARDTQDMTPLMYAITGSKAEVVSRLLKAGAKVDTKTKNGSSPLSLAIEHQGPEGQMEIASRLNVGGYVANSEDDLIDDKILDTAVQSGDWRAIEMLVQRGVDLEKKITRMGEA